MPVASVRRLSRASTTGVVLLLTLGLAATGSSSVASMSHGVSTPANAAGVTLTPKALVRHIALVDSDFTDGTTVQLISHGNRVGRQVTLDNCGFNFTTERHRTARHQTLIVPATPRKSLVSNEVVAYETRHFAGKALRQLRKSVTQCPRGVFVPSSIKGAPDERYDVSRIRESAKLPVTDNAVVTLKITVKGHPKKPYWALLMFQRRGTVLDAMYRLSMKKPSAAKVAALRSLATITGNRLAAS